MFGLSLIIWSYSLSILLLGISGMLTKANILIPTLCFLLMLIYRSLRLRPSKVQPTSKPLVIFLVLLSLVNLIGSLGPELGFDALWYHLTLPKLWLSEGVISALPGHIMRYSAMPLLTETLFVPALAFGSEIFAKLVHFSFGLLFLFSTYKTAKLYLNQQFSLLATLILASNLVFAWQSTTAYVDLARSFFETAALYYFLNKNFHKSAMVLGVAICTKLISISSLPIFAVLSLSAKKPLHTATKYILVAFVVASPWLIRAQISTGNPIHPLGSGQYPISEISFNTLDIINLFIFSADPISPIYLITAPLIYFSYPSIRSRGGSALILYSLLSLLVWNLLPKTGGGRFILPYLGTFSVLTAIAISHSVPRIKHISIAVALIVTISTFMYRLIANAKYLPVLTGLQSKTEFLTHNLNYSYGDFLDTDGFLDSILKPDDLLLVVGVNNLFYLNHRYILPDYLTDPDQVDFVLWRHGESHLPDYFIDWPVIHTNPVTRTVVLTRPQTLAATTTVSPLPGPAFSQKLFYR